jgi:hypothetical protein
MDTKDFLDMNLSPNFKLKEFILLPQWEISVLPSEEILTNLKTLANKLEEVRTLIKSPLKITSGYRPKIYNKFIGGSLGSMHLQGLAADVFPQDVKLKDAVEILIANVSSLQIRLEILPLTCNWIHIDLKQPVDGMRLFYPVKKGA